MFTKYLILQKMYASAQQDTTQDNPQVDPVDEGVDPTQQEAVR